MKHFFSILIIVIGSNAFATDEFSVSMIQDLSLPDTKTCVTTFGTSKEGHVVFGFPSIEIRCGSARIAFGLIETDHNFLPMIIEKMAQQGYGTRCTNHMADFSEFICIHQK